MPTDDKQRITLFINPALVEKALIKYLPKETVIKKPTLKGGE